MDKIYAFILNWNRVDLPKNMADYLADVEGIIPVIVDNNSTYPKLLEYYEHCPHIVERLQLNYGPSLYHTGLLEKYGLSVRENNRRYIMTDPDLDLSGIPKDFLHILHLGLDRHEFATKAGFSLEIDNIPDSPMKDRIMAHEKIAWAYKLDDLFYNAKIDTTFALYRTCYEDLPAVRTDRPYTAIHIPWLYTKDNFPEDELYYFSHICGVGAYAVEIIQNIGLIEKNTNNGQ